MRTIYTVAERRIPPISGDAIQTNPLAVAPADDIPRAVLVRGRKVLLDTELAELYGVSTRQLNEQVKRNAARFGGDFLFQLSTAEVEALNRSQVAAGSQKHGNARLPRYAFSGHGAMTVAMILKTPRAVKMSILIVRAFVRLLELSSSNEELARCVAQSGTRVNKKVTEDDESIAIILLAIRELMNTPQSKVGQSPARRRVATLGQRGR